MNCSHAWIKSWVPPRPSCGAETTGDLQTCLSWSVRAGVLVGLLQCFGIWCRGSLAGGLFGIILGCGALRSEGGAGAWAGLAVGPAGGLRGVSAATVPTGRVSSTASFFHRWLEPEKLNWIQIHLYIYRYIYQNVLNRESYQDPKLTCSLIKNQLLCCNVEESSYFTWPTLLRLSEVYFLISFVINSGLKPHILNAFTWNEILLLLNS